MTALDSLAISVPTLIAIFGLVLSILTYRLKKKDSDDSHKEVDEKKLKEEAEREKQNDLRLLSIEKDVQYIRLTVDKIEARGDDHEHRIQSLEKKCKSMKGAK